MERDMPVFLKDHDPAWSTKFEVDRHAIERALRHRRTRIEHIGSTAIPGLAAKPVIDIMVLIDDITTFRDCVEPLRELHYHYVPYGEKTSPERRWFCKPNASARTHHLHLVEQGSPFHLARLRFRDYLRAHRSMALEYEKLKRTLAEIHREDRNAYTEGKSEFVERTLRAAIAYERESNGRSSESAELELAPDDQLRGPQVK